MLMSSRLFFMTWKEYGCIDVDVVPVCPKLMFEGSALSALFASLRLLSIVFEILGLCATSTAV